jgi:hypothetical protein
VAGAGALVIARFRQWLWHQSYYEGYRFAKLPLVGTTVRHAQDRHYAKRVIPDLRALHDVLESSDLAGRYWLWGGLLLGWAREGGLIAHDRDVDFALMAEDLPRLLRACQAVQAAGFIPLNQFFNNEGRLTELTFRKHGARFEFYVLDQVDSNLRYFSYGMSDGNYLEVEGLVPQQGLVPFEFFDRTWLRHDDYERELDAMYGDWRTPRSDWNYLTDTRSNTTRRPWLNTETQWRTP